MGIADGYGFDTGKILWTAGFGRTNSGTEVDPLFPKELMHTGLFYDPDCRNIEMDPDVISEDHMICAGPLDEVESACSGDSGGPLFDRDNNVLVGITSFGDTGMCAAAALNIVSYFKFVSFTFLNND